MRPSRVVLLSLALSAVSGVALAQPAPPPPGGPGAERGHWDPAKMREHREARHAERDKALHDVLGIQPTQEAAFTAFTSAMKPPEWRHEGGRDGAAPPMAMTTPERLDRMKAEMDKRFAAMREAFDRRAEATRALYAVLDPRQRAAMDALPELTGHPGGKGHGDRMGPPGPMGAGM
jgi:Spy/CpxP family protein refolding chaperone